MTSIFPLSTLASSSSLRVTITPYFMPSSAMASLNAADLAQARCVASGFVRWKLLLSVAIPVDSRVLPDFLRQPIT